MRAKTFVEPPGMAAIAVPESTKPLATSFNVPSPPSTTTMSIPSLAAFWAIRVA